MRLFGGRLHTFPRLDDGEKQTCVGTTRICKPADVLKRSTYSDYPKFKAPGLGFRLVHEEEKAR